MRCENCIHWDGDKFANAGKCAILFVETDPRWEGVLRETCNASPSANSLRPPGTHGCNKWEGHEGNVNVTEAVREVLGAILERMEKLEKRAERIDQQAERDNAYIKKHLQPQLDALNEPMEG